MQQSKTRDLLVVGAGVLGLWVAREAARRGLSVSVIDAAAGPGAGASGTPLAVLLPHLPDRIEPKRAFQRDALLGLGREIAAIERETCLTTGYVQRGRVMPIAKATFLAKAEAAVRGAGAHWAGPSAPVCRIIAPGSPPASEKHHAIAASGGVLNITPQLDGWLDPDGHPFGVLHDTLSAAIRADAYVAALAKAVAQTCDLHWGRSVTRYDAATGTVVDQTGTALPATRAVVVSAGFGSFEILTRLLGRATGDGVKGHAATFQLERPLATPDARPVLYDSGIYVVPLDARTVSVGSTTEYDWADARPSQAAATAMIARAMSLCPPLRRARQTGLWSGIRPRAATRNPLVGALPVSSSGAGRLYVATGGYKITFGIAHRLAACLVDEMIDGAMSPRLPKAFHASALAA